ncbi:MAG: nucleotidyltransferase domain-containing protein [Verrucomicrobia bacterium]|nr:nucleotidyltransferase domain-containing protein [Verrucomicrobiota bacterium]
MKEKFNRDEAKKYLLAEDAKKKAFLEKERQRLFETSLAVLRKEFQGSGVEVFLVGSILHSGRFTPNSDVDIVVKNFTGDRFILWTRLEEAIGRNVEVIRFELCPFQEFVSEEGYKVV